MIDSTVIERLRRIGLTNAQLQLLAQRDAAADGAQTLRITEVQREGLTLHDGQD